MPRAKRVDTEWNGQVRMLPGPKLVELEKSTMARIQTYVQSRGYFCVRNSVTPGERGKAAGGCGTGSADLHAIVNGIAVWIETKRPKGGHIRKEQTEFVEAVRRAGGVAGFAKSIEETAALIDEAEKKRPR